MIYGFDESKSKKEVYIKEETYSKEEVYTKEQVDEMILERKMSSDFATVSTEVSDMGIVTLNYPSNFTSSNCVIVSIMYRSAGGSYKTSIAGSDSGIQVSLATSGLNIVNNVIDSGTIKITLMKTV